MQVDSELDKEQIRGMRDEGRGTREEDEGQMKLYEFRIVMPLTLDEYQRGQIYAMCEMSRNETGGGDGVQVLVHEPFEDHPLFDGQFRSGQYTFKKYFMYKKLNALIRSIAPKGSLEFEEYAWNAYPYCKTVIKNEAYMKDNFELRIESMHLANDKGSSENVHLLDEELLRKREVVFIDIADERLRSKQADDLSNFRSSTTNRGPLFKDWLKRTDIPFMCCYKLVTVKFKWWGLQNTVEDMLLANQQKLFERFHRSMFLWIDKWHGKSFEELEVLTKKTIEDLNSRRESAGIRGSGME